MLGLDKNVHSADGCNLGRSRAVLTHSDGEIEQVIAYASRPLNKAEKNYSVTELGCLAVKWGIWKMTGYLEGYHFIIPTDHQSLKWFDKIKNPSGRLVKMGHGAQPMELRDRKSERHGE